MKSISKYILASSLVAILTITLFGLYSLEQYHDNEVREEHEKLETCIRTFWQLLAHKGTDFRVVGGNLLIDNYPVNGNFELPDKIQEIFGGVATIFMGDERVSTNVLTGEGKRAVGTRLVGPAYDAIFKEGKSYRGATAILDVPYLTAYDPIRDRRGEVIGVLFVGVKESEFLDRMYVLKMHLTLTLFGMVTVSTIFMVLLGRAVKTAEETTKNAYQQLLDIVDFLPDATFVVDKDKRVIAWNRAIEQMTGIEKKDIMGKGDYVYAIPFYNNNRPLLIDLLGQEQEQERLLRNYLHIKQEGNTLFTEVFVPSFRNGGSRYFWATATPLFDKEGNPAGGIESIRDITEYKQAEEEKLRMKSQLNQALMMETLMVRLGHDLKTPLTPLFVMLSLLKKRVSEPDSIRMVDMCIKNAASINNLADKTGLLANLTSTVDPHELEWVSLASIVDQALASCVDMIYQKRIDCRNNVDPAVVVRVVPPQLHELFVNLISNAVHFSAENGAIVISAEQHDEAVMISVRDEGIGLAPAHLGHIFDEFFKADESRHDLDASGLGLAICKRVVRNHHGRIWAESPGPGKGTTIKFTINEQSADSRHVANETL